jgi:hypothetical protein
MVFPRAIKGFALARPHPAGRTASGADSDERLFEFEIQYRYNARRARGNVENPAARNGNRVEILKMISRKEL